MMGYIAGSFVAHLAMLMLFPLHCVLIYGAMATLGWQAYRYTFGNR